MSVSKGPPTPRRLAARLIAQVGLLVLSLAIALLASEGLVRLAAPQPASWMDIYARRPGLPFFVLAPRTDEVAVTGETHWRVVTDERGHRVPETVDPRPGAGLTLALGDSFTFGNSVDYQESFVGLLDAADPSQRITNLAVPGHGPTQYRMLLEEALREGPAPDRVLIVTYLGNDFHDCLWNKDLPVRDGIIGDPGGLKAVVKRNSHLYRLCSNLWHTFGGRADDMGSEELYLPSAWKTGPLSRAYETYREEFSRIQALCEARGIDLFACVIPTIRSVAGADARSESGSTEPLDLGLPARKARDVFEGLGIPFVDVSPDLAKLGSGRAYFRFDSHLTPAGNQVVARRIATRWPSTPPEVGTRPDTLSRKDQP